MFCEVIHLSRQMSRKNTRELFLFQKIRQQEELGKISHPNPRDPDSLGQGFREGF